MAPHSRTLVIGDIHGALKALQQLLAKAEVTSDDTLIFLGDYVDGWSESAGVIDFLMDLEQQQPCIFLKGNHDEWTESWLTTDRLPVGWHDHGGKATFASYSRHDAKACAQHIDFFSRLRYYFVDAQNRLFVHAGFTSPHGPQSEYLESNLIWERTLWEMTVAMDRNLTKDSLRFPKRLKLFHEIYIGHTPTTNYHETKPMNIYNVWNVDTGAAFKGPLTLLDINTKQFWQSDPVHTLYPDEKGRN
ncbi:metallophosphoesterase family protein [Chryseolinea lacunae]|uniref:Serine/threonine protein phosphatase n=1 Tax=Chryseolinea lacunae TaxID=2801331 RepID=A0ABS1KUY1_9BACT|nr:metallophosphoesterase family protein [Chryseolinea lacunae]MBL0743179.1 serine/threonine protein phosphatase [Chryseolinea lacunae]